jgi:hypothetical protein
MRSRIGHKKLCLGPPMTITRENIPKLAIFFNGVTLTH